MTRQRIRLGAWLILGASVAACGDDRVAPNDASVRESSRVWATPLESDSGAPPPQEIMPLSAKEKAYGTDLGGGNYHVDVRNADGFAVFSSDFAATGGEYKVGYTLFSPDLKAGSSAVGSNEMSFAHEASDTSLETAIQAATYTYLRIKKEMNGNYATNSAADYHGCDLGPLGLRASCSNLGACCEAHDQCFIKNGCIGLTMVQPVFGSGLVSLASQLGQYKLTPQQVAHCQQVCNAPVESCMLQLDGPGMAPCCNDNTCGQPRVPGVPPKQNAPGDSLFGVPSWAQVPQTKQKGGNFWYGRHVQPQTGEDGGAGAASGDCDPDDQACKFSESCDLDTGEGCQQPQCDQETGAGCDGQTNGTSSCDEQTGEGCQPTQCDEQTGEGCDNTANASNGSTASSSSGGSANASDDNDNAQQGDGSDYSNGAGDGNDNGQNGTDNGSTGYGSDGTEDYGSAVDVQNAGDDNGDDSN